MEEVETRIFTPVNVIAIGSLLLASAWLAWWFYDRTQYLYVTDARVSSTLVSVSSRLPGLLIDFRVKEGQQVKKGEVLVAIDTRDADLQMVELEANLHTSELDYQRLQSEFALRVRQIDSAIAVSRSRHETAEIEMSEATVVGRQADKDLIRANSLLKQNMIPEGSWESTKTSSDMAVQALQVSKARVATAAAELTAAEIRTDELKVLQHELGIIRSQQLELEANRTRLQNTLTDYQIKSPRDGVVDETFANSGEYVYPGQRILMMHDPSNIWIKANIKETNIRKLHEGARVEVSVDAYPDSLITAKVGEIGNAATSSFALLPSPNPSGNFTKTTQRLEVKIRIDEQQEQQQQQPLKPGMMVELKIDTR
jgi:membrane fusion protein (multidrug efflux system)